MGDLEWYLEIGGKQSGPHSAKEIVEWVRSGKISETAQVTAARMSGDWVTAKDLVDAYDELFAKPKSQATTLTNSASTSDPNFQPPPRPTEQLEATKNIYLNRGTDLDPTPDPTEALFQAIQAVREKATKSSLYASTAGTSPSPVTTPRDSFGQVKRAGGPTFPPQVILIATLAAIFGITIYGISALIGGKKAENEAKKPVAEAAKKINSADPVENTAQKSTFGNAPGGSSGLLNADGAGTGTLNQNTKITPRRPPANPTRNTRTSPRLDPGGGARYRDDSDIPPNRRIVEDEDEDVDEIDSDAMNHEPVPVDPSQVPVNKVIPEPGSMPGAFPDGPPEQHSQEENPGQ